MDEVIRLINQIAALTDDKDFKLEFKAFKSAFQRLKVRLRNNQLIAHLKQLAFSTRKLQNEFSAEVTKTYVNQLINSDGKKREKHLKSLRTYIQNFIEYLDNLLGQTLFVYGYTQPHFRVGHLIHHLIVLRTCISRYRICMKALLVYCCDLYTEITNLNLIESALSKDCLDQILKKHDCKPRNLSAIFKTKSSIETIEILDDEVGELIDRNTMKVEKDSKTKKIKLN